MPRDVLYRISGKFARGFCNFLHTFPVLPKPLPLGEVSPKVTERASPWRQKRRHSDKQALCQSDEIAVRSLCCEHPCPLRRFAPALPKGEPFGYTSTTFYHTFPPATRLNGRKTAKTGRKVEKMRGNHSAAAPQSQKTLGKKRQNLQKYHYSLDVV